VPEIVIESRGPIQKIDDERQIVYAWASVITKNNIAVEDSQGDKIAPETLLDCAHEFITESRKGGFMHVPDLQVGNIVESMVFTYDLQKSLGVKIVNKAGEHIEGWLVGYHVDSQTLWKRVKSGDFAELSIGGLGVRIPEVV
jgi:hypothetical protein